MRERSCEHGLHRKRVVAVGTAIRVAKGAVCDPTGGSSRQRSRKRHDFMSAKEAVDATTGASSKHRCLHRHRCIVEPTLLPSARCLCRRQERCMTQQVRHRNSVFAIGMALMWATRAVDDAVGASSRQHSLHWPGTHVGDKSCTRMRGPSSRHRSRDRHGTQEWRPPPVSEITRECFNALLTMISLKHLRIPSSCTACPRPFRTRPRDPRER